MRQKKKNQSNLETLKRKASVFEVHVSCRFIILHVHGCILKILLINIFLDFHSPCKAKSLLHVSIIQWMHITFVSMNEGST